jgi:subtilisin family serine protease
MKSLLGDTTDSMGAYSEEEGGGVLPNFGVAVAEIGASAVKSLSENDWVVEVRPEFYMFADDKRKEDLFKWARCGLLQLVDQLQCEESPWEGFGKKEVLPVPHKDTMDYTWGLYAVKSPVSLSTGKGIKLCVLDTGLDEMHPDFRRPIVRQNFSTSMSNGDIQGHGTHVCGIATGPVRPMSGRRYGTAPEVELYVGKVLDDTGSGREFDVLRGINWALAQGCHIISMSLGRAVRLDEKPDPLYEDVGTIALDNGTLIIAAAGNESARNYGYIAPVGSPANATSIMAVGSVDAYGNVSRFSCGGVGIAGGEVDIAAPGSNVYSSWPVPRYARTISGTSMSCPYVAAVAALHAESKGVRGRELWDVLVGSAVKCGDARDYGAGLVQAPW